MRTRKVYLSKWHITFAVLLLIAVAVIGALLFIILQNNEAYISQTVSINPDSKEDTTLVFDFSHQKTINGLPDGLWIKWVESAGATAPVTFILSRAEGDGNFVPFAEHTLNLHNEAIFYLPDRLQFQYKLYAKCSGDVDSISVKLSLNDFEVID